MLGLALEGGGARGAYHVGVAKAYLENGYSFDGFVGTSIGAINAAIFAQNDFEQAIKLWLEMSMEHLFSTEESNLILLSELKFSANSLANLNKTLKKIITGGGIDTSKIRAILSQHLDEEKIRLSGKDFGLVTVSINERKAYELYLEDIPNGALLNYIMASACFPGFKSEIIDDKPYIDGCLHDNCPVNMLIRKGYDEIIVVRTSGHPLRRRWEATDATIKVIAPLEELGNELIFSAERIKENMQLGYYDGLRAINSLRGRKYYIKSSGADMFENLLMAQGENTITQAAKAMGAHPLPTKRMLFEVLVPKIGSYLKLNKNFDYEDFVIALLEYKAARLHIPHYCVYSFSEFSQLIKHAVQPVETVANSLMPAIKKAISPNKISIAVEILANALID